VSSENTFKATRYLPQVVVATTAVAVLPALIVWALLIADVISSPWACVGLAIALSLVASILGSAYWKRRSGPGDMLFSELLLWGWLRRFQSERRLAKAVGQLGLDDGVDGPAGSDASLERNGETLRQLASALDAKDPYTDGHSRRVALHAAMVARKMGLSHEEVDEIRTAAAVHDIGKLRTPLEVLNKPTALTAAEFEIVKRHADEGAEIVSRMNDPQISAMVRHHHEGFDGTGYPAGLSGEQIPLGARIIAVADTFDALTSERPYRSAVPHKQALEILVSVSGTQLDPVAVRAFVKCYSGKRAILFWTVLAVSPQRALALVSGRSVSRANLGSAVTFAVPAALAAVAAAAFGGAGSAVRGQTPLRFVQRPAAATAPPVKDASSGSKHATKSSVAKHAVLASTVTRASSTASGNHAARGHSSPRPRAGSRSGSGRSRAGGGGKPRTGSGRHRGGRTHRGGGPVSGSTGGHPPVKSGSPGGSPPPTSSGTQSGGAGGGGAVEPTSKQDCKGGGWMNFSFPNQGLCVAWVVHNVLH
jgi:putative nucleotidyltransferase with HDIG domain